MATGTLPDSDQDKVVSSRESDELFNDTYGSDVARGIAEAENYAATGGSSTEKPVEDQENNPDEAGGGWNNNVEPGKATKQTSGFRSTLRKRGPLIAIFGSFGIGGIALIFLVIPGILLFHILANMFGTLDPSSTALTQVTKIMLMNKLGSNEATLGGCSNPVIAIACRFKTPSNELLRELKANGITALDSGGKPFDLSTDAKWPTEKPTKFKISSFATENGVEKTFKASELSTALRENSVFRKSFDKVVKKVGVRAYSRFSPAFLRVMERFHFGLSDKLNIKQRLTDKGKVLVTDALEKGIKAFGIESATESAKAITASVSLQISKALTRIDKVSKGSGVVLAAAAQCMANQVPGMIKKAMGAIQEQAAVSTSAPVITAISAIKAGDGDPDTASGIGTAFTQTDSTGKSAMDSAGMKYVTTGDKNTTNDPTYKTVTPNGFGDLGATLGIADSILNNPVSSEACTLLTNPVTGAAVAAGVNAAIVGSSAADFGLSFLINWGLGEAFSLILNSTTDQISSFLSEKFAPLAGNLAKPTIDKMSRPGQQFGNVMAFGVGVTTTNKAANTFGNYVTTDKLPALSKTIKDQQIADAAFDRATLSPFDSSSPYTFTGSLVSQLTPYYSSLTTVGGGLAFLGSLVPTSIGSILKPSSVNAADMSLYDNACPDTSSLKLADGSGKTLAANIFCQPVAATTIPDNWDPNATVNSMLSMQTDGQGEINPESGKALRPSDPISKTVVDTIGAVTSLIPGSTLSYADWLDTCSDPNNAVGCASEDKTLQTYSLYTAANEASILLDGDQAAAKAAAITNSTVVASDNGTDSALLAFDLPTSQEQTPTTTNPFTQLFSSFASLFKTPARDIFSSYNVSSLQLAAGQPLMRKSYEGSTLWV